jgi:hypothetical protein
MAIVVPLAEEPAPLDGRRAAERPPVEVIELEPVRGPAHAAALERPDAAPAVALPDRPPHLGGDVAAARGRLARRRPHARLRRASRLPRLAADPAPLAVALDDEVEAELEDRLLGSAWV